MHTKLSTHRTLMLCGDVGGGVFHLSQKEQENYSLPERELKAGDLVCVLNRTAHGDTTQSLAPSRFTSARIKSAIPMFRVNP